MKGGDFNEPQDRQNYFGHSACHWRQHPVGRRLSNPGITMNFEQQLELLERVTRLIQESVKVVIAWKLVEEICKTNEEDVRQGLSLTLASILQSGMPLQQIQPDFY
jgi:hypothetical protein